MSLCTCIEFVLNIFKTHFSPLLDMVTCLQLHDLALPALAWRAMRIGTGLLPDMGLSETTRRATKNALDYCQQKI